MQDWSPSTTFLSLTRFRMGERRNRGVPLHPLNHSYESIAPGAVCSAAPFLVPAPHIGIEARVSRMIDCAHSPLSLSLSSTLPLLPFSSRLSPPPALLSTYHPHSNSASLFLTQGERTAFTHLPSYSIDRYSIHSFEALRFALTYKFTLVSASHFRCIVRECFHAEDCKSLKMPYQWSTVIVVEVVSHLARFSLSPPTVSPSSSSLSSLLHRLLSSLLSLSRYVNLISARPFRFSSHVQRLYPTNPSFSFTCYCFWIPPSFHFTRDERNGEWISIRPRVATKRLPNHFILPEFWAFPGWIGGRIPLNLVHCVHFRDWFISKHDRANNFW